MMEFVGGWLKQIILLVLVATFFDLLLPNHSMERYVKLVMGLLIILAILNPIFSLLDKNLDLASFTAESQGVPVGEVPALSAIRREGEALQKTQDRLILSQVQQKLAETIKQDVEGQFEVRVVKSEVSVSQAGEKESPAIQRVQLVISPRRNEGEGGEVMPVQPVEPVVIGPDRPASAGRDSPSPRVPSRIASYLEQKWELSTEQVHVTWEDAS
ncbi:MAG: stage III sporulation protein AF [Planifilum fulgidum]